MDRVRKRERKQETRKRGGEGCVVFKHLFPTTFKKHFPTRRNRDLKILELPNMTHIALGLHDTDFITNTKSQHKKMMKDLTISKHGNDSVCVGC